MFQDLIGRISAYSPESAASGLEAVSGAILTASKTDSLGSVQSLLESFSTDPASLDVWGDPNVVQPQGWAQFQEPVSFLQDAKASPGSPYSFADVAQNLQDGEFNQASILSDLADSFFGDQGGLFSMIGSIFGNLVPPQAAENAAVGFNNPFSDVMLNPQPLPPKEGSSQDSFASFDDLALKLSGPPGGPEEGLQSTLTGHMETLQNFRSVLNESNSLQQDFRFRGGFRI
jgi:hypothetical protein